MLTSVTLDILVIERESFLNYNWKMFVSLLHEEDEKHLKLFFSGKMAKRV